MCRATLMASRPLMLVAPMIRHVHGLSLAAQHRVHEGSSLDGVDAAGQGNDIVGGDVDELGEGADAAAEGEEVHWLSGADVNARAVNAERVREPGRGVVFAGGAGLDDLMKASGEDADLDGAGVGWRRRRGHVDGFGRGAPFGDLDGEHTHTVVNCGDGDGTDADGALS
ncbi:hypothetical protein G7046_g8658 [Stylonectria norvegica]|nr:hypothetical protein G7046_g8658 [Stylonectria norvegica]